MTKDDQSLLTIGEAAELLRAPIATLRWWRHNGTGPHSFKIGRHVVYRQTDVDKWIAQQVIAHRGGAADGEQRVARDSMSDA